MTSKGSWDSLAGPLVSWAVGLAALVFVLAAALSKYVDLSTAVGRIR